MWTLAMNTHSATIPNCWECFISEYSLLYPTWLQVPPLAGRGCWLGEFTGLIKKK